MDSGENDPNLVPALMPTRKWKLKNAAEILLPPAGAILLGIVLWYLIIYVFNFKEYILPAPEQVLKTFLAKHRYLLEQSAYTMTEAIGGFLLGVIFAVPCAIAIVASPLIDRAISPLLIFSQAFPKAAIAPLFVIWFGFGLMPKVIVAFLITYFPIVISLVVGMRAVETDLLDLVRSMKASTLQIFFKVRIPFSLPFFFAGLKTAAAFALAGAVVGEWVGASKGLGYVLTVANADLDTKTTFAVLVLLMVYGFAWVSALSWLEKRFVRWHVSNRDQAVGGGM